MSPILVRPVREQLEHDRVIRLLQQDLSKRKVEVGINPGTEQNAPVGSGSRKEYPDAVLYSIEKGKKVIGVVEVETGESVNHLEAMAQWAHLAKLKVPFHLYVPMGSVDVARRLSADYGIPVTEIWSYHQVGDQFRFTLIHPVSSTRGGRSAPAPRTVSVASIRVAQLPEIEVASVEEPPAAPVPAPPATPARRVVASKGKAQAIQAPPAAPTAVKPKAGAKATTAVAAPTAVKPKAGAKATTAVAAPKPAPAKAAPKPAPAKAAPPPASKAPAPVKPPARKQAAVKPAPAKPASRAAIRPVGRTSAKPTAKNGARPAPVRPARPGARVATRPIAKPARAPRPKASGKGSPKATGRRR